jgi:hypothetical protein
VSPTFERDARELAAVGRVRAVAAEGEEPVERGAVQLDVRGRLHVAGDQTQQVALLDQARQQLLDAGEHVIFGGVGDGLM